MVREEKRYAVEEIGRLIDESSSLILTTFTGLDSTRMNALRTAVGRASSRYFVVKNRTFAIAAKERGLEPLCRLVGGQIGVAFGSDEGFGVLKTLVEFGKENEQLKVVGGLFDGEVRTAEEMLAIAVMPPREVAGGELVWALAGPVCGLLQVMSEVVRELVLVIKGITERKESSGLE